MDLNYRKKQTYTCFEVSRSLSGTLNSVGLLWTSDRPVAEPSTWQHTTQHKQGGDNHNPGRIWTRNPRKRAAADPRLRPRGPWDRPYTYILG
jgi:hypothetical protein